MVGLFFGLVFSGEFLHSPQTHPSHHSRIAAADFSKSAMTVDYIPVPTCGRRRTCVWFFHLAPKVHQQNSDIRTFPNSFAA